MPIAVERLREIVSELASRPGHEKVRALIYQLLVDGLGTSSTEVDFERPVPEVHGRIDALLGAYSLRVQIGPPAGEARCGTEAARLSVLARD